MRSWITTIILILVISLLAVGQPRREQRRPVPTNESLAKANQARTILQQAKAAALKIKSDFKRGFVLDEIGAAQAKTGALVEALDTANKAAGFHSATLQAIADQLAATNDLTRAKSLGLKLKAGGASALISNMSRRQAESGNIDQALQTAGQIQFLEVRSYALEDIGQLQNARGDYAGAEKTFALAKAAHAKGLVTAEDREMMILMHQLSMGEMQSVRKTIDAWESAVRRYSAMIGGAAVLLQRGDKASATTWAQEALQALPAGPKNDFLRYVAIPLQVKLGQKERAMQTAGTLSGDLWAKAYIAVAVTCAEAKDVAGVNAALEEMLSVAKTKGEDKELSEFVMKLMILNVTAALIDNGQFETASWWLTTVEQDPDSVDVIAIEPNARLQRVFMLAQQGQFKDALALAREILIGSVDEVARGNALRITALLQARNAGVASAQQWALALTDPEDRAYALLGIAQALLKIDNLKLDYSAIQVH